MEVKATYSAGFKEQALSKVLSRGSRTIQSVADELNMNVFTLNKAVRHRVGHALPLAEDPLPANSQQRERRPPRRRSHLAEADFHGRIAVGVPLDQPFKAQVQQRGVFDMEAARLGRVLGSETADGEEE